MNDREILGVIYSAERADGAALVQSLTTLYVGVVTYVAAIATVLTNGFDLPWQAILAMPSLGVALLAQLLATVAACAIRADSGILLERALLAEFDEGDQLRIGLRRTEAFFNGNRAQSRTVSIFITAKDWIPAVLTVVAVVWAFQVAVIEKAPVPWLIAAASMYCILGVFAISYVSAFGRQHREAVTEASLPAASQP